MWIALLSVAVVLIWFGVDALSLARHTSPPTQIEKDDMMFGEGHKRPVSDVARSFAERRYPFATASSLQVYGCLFIAAGVMFAFLAWATRW